MRGLHIHTSSSLLPQCSHGLSLEAIRASAGSALSVETTLADWHAAQSAVANFNFEAHADEVPRVDARSLNDRDVLAQQLATAPLGAVLVENALQLPRELTIEQLGRRHNGLPALMKNWWNKPVRLWTCGAYGTPKVQPRCTREVDYRSTSFADYFNDARFNVTDFHIFGELRKRTTNVEQEI